jgi:hypothetical protein
LLDASKGKNRNKGKGKKTLVIGRQSLAQATARAKTEALSLDSD